MEFLHADLSFASLRCLIDERTGYVRLVKVDGHRVVTLLESRVRVGSGDVDRAGREGTDDVSQQPPRRHGLRESVEMVLGGDIEDFALRIAQVKGRQGARPVGPSERKPAATPCTCPLANGNGLCRLCHSRRRQGCEGEYQPQKSLPMLPPGTDYGLLRCSHIHPLFQSDT